MRIGIIARRMAPSLVGLLLLFMSNDVWSGTVSKTYPDLEGHIDLFLKFPLGVTQRKFRAHVPKEWRVIPIGHNDANRM